MLGDESSKVSRDQKKIDRMNDAYKNLTKA